MKQFKNVLVVGPFDKWLVAQASELMRTNQSELTLMSVVPKLDAASVMTGEGKRVNLQALLEGDVGRDVDEVARGIGSEQFRVRTVVSSGDHAFLNVINQVKSAKHDLVIMKSDGVSHIREQLFGTQSMHLMRKCPCAVWVVKSSRRKKLRNVFAAVDPDADNPQRDDLSKQVISRANAIAQNHGAKLHIIHAWSMWGGEANRCRQWLSKQEIRLQVENTVQSHRQRVQAFLQENSNGSEVVHILQGRPGEVIPETVARHKADLLVMGTVARTGIPGFFIGNTAESILNQVDCSVLTVKPKEFESPVIVAGN